jgi:hypothetical protein
VAIVNLVVFDQDCFYLPARLVQNHERDARKSGRASGHEFGPVGRLAGLDGNRSEEELG